MNNVISKTLNLKNLDLKPFVVLNNDKIYPEYEIKISDKVIILKHSGDYIDTIYLTLCDKDITCKRVFENNSGSVLKINELGIKLSGIDFEKDPKDDYFYHNENPRIYERMTFPVDYDRAAFEAPCSEFDETAGNRWADPGVICDRVGVSPYQPFPAILLSNYKTKIGLIHGTLSQDVFYHNYLFCHEDGKITFNILSSFKSLDYLEASPNRVLTDEWFLGTTENADDIEKIFEGYCKYLRKKLPTSYGSTLINRDNMVWGSWNDGIFRSVTEDIMLEEAEFLSENFPTVKWMQLDDGYAKYACDNKIAFGLGMVYEGEDGVDYDRFPNGLRYMTDKIRETGIRPAIWIGGLCPHGTKIYKEHPEWFIDYSLRIKGTSPLDVSQEEVRGYMTNAISVLCEKYGFDGVKHDFWSYAFEDSHDQFKNKDKSGYEYRKWWLKEMRSVISADGYFQTGCDIVMGNPFLGEYFTNYRYGIDIGCGNWDYVKTNFLWGAACFATHTGDLFVPNSDSVGLFPGLSETEAMFAINYCLVTHSMVEISGRLSKATDKNRLKILKKAVCNPNNGQDVYFIGYDYRKRESCVPEIMYFKTPHFSKIENSEFLPVRTVGLFNVSDEEKTLSFSVTDLGLEKDNYILTNVWTGEQLEAYDSISFNVKPHASMLLAVSKKKKYQIFDANARINDVKLSENELFVEFDYKTNDVELKLSEKVKNVLFNGAEIPWTYTNNQLNFDLPDKGIVKIIF